MAEMVAVLDDCGMETGVSVTREEAHSKSLLHRIAIACIIDSDNRILMQHRAPGKKLHPNKWDLSVAAHVLTGEESVGTIVREMNEEIGFQMERKIHARDFRFIASFRQDMVLPDRTECHWYDLFVVIKDLDSTQLRFTDSEVDGIKWCNYSEIMQMKDNDELFPRIGWIPYVFRFINKF